MLYKALHSTLLGMTCQVFIPLRSSDFCEVAANPTQAADRMTMGVSKQPLLVQVVGCTYALEEGAPYNAGVILHNEPR